MSESIEVPRRETLEGALEEIAGSSEANASLSAARRAVHLARLLQHRATELQTPGEKKQQAELERMMQNPKDKATLTQMTDQAFRSSNPGRAVSQLTHILDVQGVPRFFSRMDRTLLRGFQSFGGYLPGVAVPLVKEKMREETANVILPAERELLSRHLEARTRAGVRMNVNFLGEALLGEDEALERLESYLQSLQMPELETLSVKISTIYSQISSLAYRHSIEVLCDRLELLYRAAAKMKFTRADGTIVPKFVYLDMEEYRDMGITAEVFMRTLDRKGLENFSAGIALQAYMPDSFSVQKRIIEWARERARKGGAPVTIRFVKGANLEMERVEAAIQGWPQAPFKTKLEVDANYKRMLHEGMRPENIEAVHLGVASHNLFDIAYGLILAVENRALDKVQFEMLEGMANHQRRALLEVTNNLLLYAPAIKKEEFIYAIGYLIRRLDENTGPDNFLRHAFKLKVDSPEWVRLEESFLASFELIDNLPSGPRRTQNRNLPVESIFSKDESIESFVNEPDTDFTLPENVAWAESILKQWRGRSNGKAPGIPLIIGGREIFEGRPLRDCLDPSRPGVVVGRFRLANENDARQAVACAQEDGDGWRDFSPGRRSEVLGEVAREIRRSRGTLVGAALADGGKLIGESDPEVSEAVDFCEFYRRSASQFHRLKGVKARGKGVIVIVPPWNFPIAIPCGGMAAALAAGNTVILKPASESVLVAYELCQCFWRAGVSRRTLQFVPCAGATVGAGLVSDPGVDVVILTGGTDTAFAMLRNRPEMNLLAETGGKNATIVTALSDREQAIKHVLHSAFSHGGQKCSATSLLILEEEVFEDSHFRKTLCDAVRSMRVGSAWELPTRVGPLIHPPEGNLETALKELEPGESWAVMPRNLEGNPNLYSPAVKWGVQPGGFTHMTELFGPVLGVMKAKNLDEAISLVNQTGYGLTSGLESLDEREQEIWREEIEAGNLYINRVTTGAVVLRQPFGGMGKSAFGPGIKAGGPNYVAQLMDFEEAGGPGEGGAVFDPQLAEMSRYLSGLLESRDGFIREDESGGTSREESSGGTSRDELSREELLRGGISREELLRDEISRDELSRGGISREELLRTISAIASYSSNFRRVFAKFHDNFRLLGEDGIYRYRPVKAIRIRVHPNDTAFDLLARVCASKTVGCRATVSLPPGFRTRAVDMLEELTESWAGSIEFVEESNEHLAEVIRVGQTDRVRYAAPDRVPPEVFAAVQETGLFVARSPVLAEGRLELLWYLREQSISHSYHRYGNLGPRAEEERATVL